jgi:hypothetical protein
MSGPSLNNRPGSHIKPRGTSAQRFELYNAFWDRSTAGNLTRIDALTWFALYRHARPDRTVCISFGKLAQMLNCHRQTASRSIHRLREARLLKRVQRGGRDQGSNVYKLSPYDPTRATDPDEGGVSASAYRV